MAELVFFLFVLVPPILVFRWQLPTVMRGIAVARLESARHDLAVIAHHAPAFAQTRVFADLWGALVASVEMAKTHPVDQAAAQGIIMWSTPVGPRAEAVMQAARRRYQQDELVMKRLDPQVLMVISNLARDARLAFTWLVFARPVRATFFSFEMLLAMARGLRLHVWRQATDASRRRAATKGTVSKRAKGTVSERAKDTVSERARELMGDRVPPPKQQQTSELLGLLANAA